MREQTSFKFDVPSVSELTASIRQLLESGFSDILVEGELSNVNQSRNGHLYFTVKDNEAQLPCVMWKSTAERSGTELLDGQQVILGGSIQVYPPHGKYQMVVSMIEQAGTGKLQRAFEDLKKKLQDEGLFDESRKRKLPAFPLKIGIVTSSAGAAFHDIRSTLEHRWPLAEIQFYHAGVQGVQAAPELVRGIQYFSERKEVDVLIIGRGGGSLEDLWPFNEEPVARAIFDCAVPVISAVGHEVDFSISDFVSDARAATPTQAAVMATPDINEIRFLAEDLGMRLTSILDSKLIRYKDAVLRAGDAYSLITVRDRIKNQAERIGYLRQSMNHRFEGLASGQLERIRNFRNNMEQKIDRKLFLQKERLAGRIHRLEKADPDAPLGKGYARVRQEGIWIRQAEKFRAGDKFDLEWKDGIVHMKDSR